MSLSLSKSQYVKSHKMVCPNKLNTIAEYMISCNDTKPKLGFTRHQK